MGPWGFKESDTTEKLTYTVLYEDSFTEGQLKKKKERTSTYRWESSFLYHCQFPQNQFSGVMQLKTELKKKLCPELKSKDIINN